MNDIAWIDLNAAHAQDRPRGLLVFINTVPYGISPLIICVLIGVKKFVLVYA